VAANPEYNLTDDARVCIVQARFEALQGGGQVVEPEHLVLGVVKGVAPVLSERLFPVRGDFLALCHALDSLGEPAPLSTRDVLYSEGATAAILGAVHLAGTASPEESVTPLHLLLGVHAPAPPMAADRERLIRTQRALEDAGVTPAHLRALLSVAG
jgi:hypothetical protein